MNVKPEAFFKHIPLPEPDLAKLVFCNSNKPAHVKKWAEELPATQIQKTSVRLYRALPELTKLKIDPASRLQMLESLRPYVQSCIQGLSQDFLNQPLILPESAVKSATIAQALQKHMTTGYELVVKDICLNDKTSNAKQLEQLTLALHRAISGLGLILLRGYQLYIPSQRKLWVQVHQLYKLAEFWECTQVDVADTLLSLTRCSNITNTYHRILLLASTRPNQLRQNEVNAIYNALELWAPHVNLVQGTQNRENLFVVNLSSDLPPMYKNRFRGDTNDDIRELDTRSLIPALKQTMNKSDEAAKRVFREISSSLLTHLNNAWCVNRQRHFERRLSKGTLDVCIGLSHLHYCIADETPFKNLLQGQRGRKNLKGSRLNSSSIDEIFGAKPMSADVDPWADSFDAGGSRIPLGDVEMTSELEEASSPEYPKSKVSVLDTSPGGYCLNWEESIPPQVRAGEIIGLREPERRAWSIGLIRWVSQSKGSSQVGVEVLAPQGQAIGASMINKMGDRSDFLRALMLPEVKTINQAASLITATVPFHEQAKITLNQDGQERKAQLQHEVMSTGTIAQFVYRELESQPANQASRARDEHIPEPAASEKTNQSDVDDFDSLWD